MAEGEADFARMRRLILGVRAAGLALVCFGAAGPALLMAQAIVAAVRVQDADLPGAGMGPLSRFLSLLGSKAFFLEWWSVGGMWLMALVLGSYLLKRDAREVIRIQKKSAR